MVRGGPIAGSLSRHKGYSGKSPKLRQHLKREAEKQERKAKKNTLTEVEPSKAIRNFKPR